MNLANFWLGFPVFALTKCSFTVLVPCVVCTFSLILYVFGFVNNGGFGDFSVQCMLRFFWFYHVAPCSCTTCKTLIPTDYLYSFLPRLSLRGMHDKSSLFRIAENCQTDYERLKITSNITWLVDLWTLDCGLPSFYSLIVSCLPFSSGE